MRLKELRELNNKTQLEIAEQLKIPPMTYNNYEKARCKPSTETLIKLADLYCVTMDYLIGRDFNNEFGYLSDNEKQLLNNFKKLSPINQIKVLSEIKGFLMAQD